LRNFKVDRTPWMRHLLVAGERAARTPCRAVRWGGPAAGPGRRPHGRLPSLRL